MTTSRSTANRIAVFRVTARGGERKTHHTSSEVYPKNHETITKSLRSIADIAAIPKQLSFRPILIARQPIGRSEVPCALEGFMRKLRGRVIWYCATKGFGFISRADGPDCFLHEAALHGRKTLPDGTEVEFELAGTDGLHVDNVSPIKPAVCSAPKARVHRKISQAGRTKDQTRAGNLAHIPLATR